MASRAAPPRRAAGLAFCCLLAALLAAAVADAQVPAPVESLPEVPARVEPAPLASARVSEASVAALLFDLARIVAAEENSGWLLDESAQNEIHRDVMESVCRSTPEVRARAEQQVREQSATAGDPRALFERAGGRRSSEVDAALEAQRTLAALQRAAAAAPRECPFWVRPDPEFRGLQSTRDRWIINFDTGGFGRVLGGYSFTRISLLAGAEFGGGALVVPNSHPTAFVVNYIPAIPVLLRWHRDAWNLDLEAASVGLFQAGNTRFSYGLRGGMTIGVSGLRVRGILPWVGIGVASEYHFENSARPAAWYLRGGLRVGGVWGS
jgi:hypothetical protein